MTVEETIKSRRTIFNFRPDRVPDELLSRLLEAGIYAPNHKLTEPWRFTVLSREKQAAIAELSAQTDCETLAPDQAKIKKVQLIAKLMSKPNVVLINCARSADEKQHHEDLLAVACAIQNIQLTAWEYGVGCQWSTGKLIRNPAVLQQLDIARDEVVVGALYLGYPAEVPPMRKRKAFAEVVRWK